LYEIKNDNMIPELEINREITKDKIMKNAFLVFLLICSIPASAQEGKWYIFTSTDTLNRVVLNRLEGDTLMITAFEGDIRLPVESIRVIRTMKKSRVGRSIGVAIPVGLAVGATTGAIWGWRSYKKPLPDDYWGHRFDIGKRGTAIVSGIAGAVIGGGVGALVGGGIGNPNNQEFKLYTMTYEQKLQTVWTILSLYNE
jgi:hypothetical protein